MFSVKRLLSLRGSYFVILVEKRSEALEFWLLAITAANHLSNQFL